MIDRAHQKLEEMTANFESFVPRDVQEELRRFFHVRQRGSVNRRPKSRARLAPRRSR